MDLPDDAASPDRRKQRTRKAALDAFAALLLEQGFEAVTVSAVAERAGIGRSTLYEHFRTRDELLAASVEWPLRALAAQQPEPAALQALLDHVRAHAGSVRLLLAQPLRSRIAGVLAAHMGARLRAQGLPVLLADMRALAAAEAQLAVLALWVRGGGGAGSEAVAGELARIAGIATA